MGNFVLYDLAAKNRDVRFSPFCWIAKFGLLHKEIDYKTVALGFLPKSDYPVPDYGKLPMLAHDDELIQDSQNILEYLEKNFPEKSYIEGAQGQARFEKYSQWQGNELFPNIAPLMFHRVSQALPDNEASYFRETREERFGNSLKNLAQTPGLAENVEKALSVVADDLTDHPFLGGKTPDMSDYLVASPLLWKKSITQENIFQTPAAVDQWMGRLGEHFGEPIQNIACAEC